VGSVKVELDVQRVTTSNSVPDKRQFQCWVEAVPGTWAGRSALTIRIVDETEAKQINREYRNKDYATNVLSFSADLPEGLPKAFRQAQLGDLLICAPIVRREAKQQRRPEADHWAHLTIHGVLHLLGYDHELNDEALVMEALEVEILADLGISDPYRDIA